MRETEQQPSTSRRQAVASKRIKTLLVDDSPIMLELLGRIIAQERAVGVIGTASNGHKALLSAASLGPELVLVPVRENNQRPMRKELCL